MKLYQTKVTEKNPKRAAFPGVERKFMLSIVSVFPVLWYMTSQTKLSLKLSSEEDVKFSLPLITT